MSCPSSSAWAACPGGRSKTAVTCPCVWLWRTRPPSPRAPSARESASRRIVLPAPVSPVRIVKPAENSRSSWLISTTSRMERRASMAARSGGNDRVVDLRHPGARIVVRRQPLALQERVGVLVPLAVGEVMAEHRGRGLCFAGDAQAQIGLDEAVERLLRMAGRLIILQHVAEAIDGGGVVIPVQIEPAD